MPVSEPINSRQKGKRVELKAVHLLHGLGYTDAMRTAQAMGKNEGMPDVLCPSLAIHIEVKGDKSISLGTIALDDACDQAERDSCGKPWCVLWWEHRKGWRLTVRDSRYNALATYSRVEEIGLVLATYRRAA